MTPQEIEKAAEAWADNPEHRHKHKIWMRPSHIDAYKSGANLVMERVRVLKTLLEWMIKDATELADEITGSPNTTQIKGRIESLALGLGHAAITCENSMRAALEGK